MVAEAPVAPPPTAAPLPAGVRLQDFLDLVPATVRLLRAQQALRTRERGGLLAIAADAPTAAPDPARLPQALRLGRAIRRAARYGPVRAKCLASSLALRDWLRAAGIDGAVVRIGVRKSAAGIEAHAWVTYGDEVLGDSPWHVRTFTPIAASAAASLKW